ncbi:MAG: serine/threonine-protein kinase [Planctomycetota bacterium]|nr:serine/threonine-protein kinase [Planctomycetota bacterium]
MSPPTTGDRIGPYVLEEKIGHGGFGQVWRARHVDLKEKVVAAKIPTDQCFIDRLRREGVLQYNLKSPSIVQVIDLDVDHDPPYLLMEYVEGEDLRNYITREAPIPPERALELGIGIVAALRFAHEASVVHRDLKPENVLLPKKGGVKVADFGLGKVADDSRAHLLLSQTMQTEEIASAAGTLAYMSPEQRSGEKDIDARADIFAFGVLFFEMLTGKLPVGVAVPSDLTIGLDAELDVIYRACCAHLGRRYASATDLHSALDSARRALRFRAAAVADAEQRRMETPPRTAPMESPSTRAGHIDAGPRMVQGFAPAVKRGLREKIGVWGRSQLPEAIFLMVVGLLLIGGSIYVGFTGHWGNAWNRVAIAVLVTELFLAFIFSSVITIWDAEKGPIVFSVLFGSGQFLLLLLVPAFETNFSDWWIVILGFTSLLAGMCTYSIGLGIFDDFRKEMRDR